MTCTLGDPSCSYFSAASFAALLITSPANAHYGHMNRDEFRGPGYFIGSLSILRDFKIKEFLTFELRADAIGLTNTPHFANPNATCPGQPQLLTRSQAAASCVTRDRTITSALLRERHSWADSSVRIPEPDRFGWGRS